jgi:hypothetical protein
MSQRGHYRKCCIANQSVTRPASSPGVAKTGVTLNAVADKGPIETKLIAGLGVEADALTEFRGDSAGEFEPRRLLDQRHLIDTKRRRRARIPIAPKLARA